jgi:hypothetical protein
MKDSERSSNLVAEQVWALLALQRGADRVCQYMIYNPIMWEA